MHKRYNGYHFSANSEGIFNPFSVLNTLVKLRFGLPGGKQKPDSPALPEQLPYHTPACMKTRILTSLVSRRICAGGCGGFYEPVEAALNQIDSQAYLIPYGAGKRKPVKAGAAFNAETRTLETRRIAEA
jgi:hypothetical protein